MMREVTQQGQTGIPWMLQKKLNDLDCICNLKILLCAGTGTTVDFRSLFISASHRRGVEDTLVQYFEGYAE